MNNVAGEAGAMPLLRLSEAAAQCAQETGEQVTSDWLLQFAGKGQLKISFIARTVIPLEGGAAAGTSIIYNIGDYINLPPEWASWMHGSKEKPRTVELSLLPTPSGPRYIKDALTGKRITVEVREEDLYVSFEEITSMVSTLLERRRKANEESKVLHQQLERQVEEKRNAGRYTVAEAALCIASSAGERKEVIEQKLVRAIEAFQLPAYEPGRRAKMEYATPKDGGAFIGSGLRMKFTPPTVVRTFYEEVYWDDLNKWLAENEPRIFYKFPAPSRAELAKTDSLPYVSLHASIQPYLKFSLAELPEFLRQRVETAFYPCPEYWDKYTREECERQIQKYDYNHDPARQVERTAGWLIATMDANAWWLAESISPINAAMLLSGRNPNTQKVEDAETNTNDEMGPSDFRRLRNTFDGASDKQKTLKDWAAYARERDLKIHSWICDWEAWVREVDAKVAEQSPSQKKASSVSPIDSLPVSQPPTAGEPTKHKIKNRTQFLDAEIAQAKKSAIDNVDHKSVWVELVKLAENQFGCLLGLDGKDIKYQSGEDVKFFKLRNLRERMKRAKTH